MNEEHIGLGSTWKVPQPKETKTTTSLYADKNLVQQAKNPSLNLSRITEQALSSILDSMQTQEIKTS
jgi:post-segregation antitoxin (ccd killing protein)